MYESFFGLRERPFSVAPDPRFLFLAPAHKEALDTLRYGLSSRVGLTLLTGEAGTGKTTLVRAALAELESGTAECVLLTNPTLTRAEFYEFLANQLNLGDAAAASKAQFLLTLSTRLEDRYREGKLTTLILDEAQSLPHELLEEVRLLSNIETATTKLLNVVLAGQPELADRLNHQRLRQLKQRIALRCQLSPLGRSDAAAYIAGRLRIAGGTPMSVFTREAVETIHAASAGIPRVINVICDNALIGGFASQTRPVSRAIVEDVCRDFDLHGTQNADVKSPVSTPATEPSSSLGGDSSPTTTPPKTEQPQGGRLFNLLTPKRRFSFF
jgi:type II secretory pathway predicted ATPase ExeA